MTATWADSHQLMFSKDNHRMTTNLRSYFDRPRELLDNSGLNERRPLQVSWTLGGSGPLTTSKSAPSLGKTRKPMTKSEHKLKSRPEWNSSCFFHLGSENNSVAHDAQRKLTDFQAGFSRLSRCPGVHQMKRLHLAKQSLAYSQICKIQANSNSKGSAHGVFSSSEDV